MAYITENTHSFGAAISSAWGSFAYAVSMFFADVYRASARSEAIQELQAMDDATLKTKHGITRSQIVGYVFRDKLLP